MNVIPANPRYSTLQLTPRHRSLGKLVKLDINAELDTPAADLAGDIFHNLFGEVAPAEQIPTFRALNKVLLEMMTNTNSYEEMKICTSGNIPAAVMAGQAMFNFLQKDEAMQEAMKKLEELEKAQQEAEICRTAAEQLPDSPEKERMEQQAQEAQQKADDLKGQVDQLTKQFLDDEVTSAGLASATRTAAKKAREMSALMSGWGSTPGQGIYTDPKQAISFMSRMNNKTIQEIARLAGKMKNFALSARNNRVAGGTVPAVMGYTSTITNLLPTELAYLHPQVPDSIRAVKTAELLEVGLLGWKESGEHKEKGAFVAAVDVSASMVTGRDIVAKAVALGVAQVAKMEGRPYTLFCFGANSNKIEFVTHKDSWEAHLRWASYREHGGTDFDLAVRVAEKFIREAPFSSDCLFISDGEAVVSDKQAQSWKSLAQEKGARLFYVSVAGGSDHLSHLADQTIEVAELDEAAGGEVSRNLVNRWR